MSYPIKYPTPQGANIQIFNYATETSGTTETDNTWVKPQGASFVYFCLIGAGGSGGNGDSGAPIEGSGGGSGAVTNFMCPAFLIPDSLVVKVGKGGVPSVGSTTTQVGYKLKSGSYYTLLTAATGNGGGSSGGGGGAGGAAMTNNYFTAIGFLNSTAGQNGADAGGTLVASTTTFLSGGASSASAVPGNYGYTTNSGANQTGYFQTQPIIVGMGANLQTTTPSGGTSRTSGAIGCGGGGGAANDIIGSWGGNGMVVIITW